MRCRCAIAARLFSAVLMAMACGCQLYSPAPPTAAQRSAPVLTQTQRAQLEDRILARIDAVRKTENPQLRPLAPDKRLADIARARCERMARPAADGAPPERHLSAELLMARDATFQGLLSENVATLPGGATLDIDAAAERIVDIWLASPKHKENLLFPKYTTSGVGIAQAGDTLYAAQLFAADLQALKTGGEGP